MYLFEWMNVCTSSTESPVHFSLVRNSQNICKLSAYIHVRIKVISICTYVHGLLLLPLNQMFISSPEGALRPGEPVTSICQTLN